jgi:alpha-amylase/alpha-mannosidase (GH57 family)
MIYWAQLFHLYQPPTQMPQVLEKICNESYRPLLEVLHQNSHVRVTLNINGVLLEMLHDYGHRDIIKSLRELGEKGAVEFTGSGKYHPIFPLLPQDDRKRQIELNTDTGSRLLGKAYAPKGFFPPEMCYSDDILSEVIATGHQWVILSGVACPNTWPVDTIYQVENRRKRLAVFFRDDILSNKISFKQTSTQDFLEHLKQMKGDKDNIYIVTAMDAETYGHHIKDWENIFLAATYKQLKKPLLAICPVCNTKFCVLGYLDESPVVHVTCPECQTKLMVDFKETTKEAKGKTSEATPEVKISEQVTPEVKMVTVSELLQIFPAGEIVSPKPSSWSTSAEDIASGNPYPLWQDKDNEIHRLQWEHLHICIEIIHKAQECIDNDECALFGRIARDLLDRAEHSCQFWWASRRPMWDVNIIHLGLIEQWRAIVNAYRAINKSGADDEIKTNYYHKLVAARDIRNKIIDRFFVL